LVIQQNTGIRVSETYIGGLANDMHVVHRKRMNHETCGIDKVAVHRELERATGMEPPFSAWELTDNISCMT